MLTGLAHRRAARQSMVSLSVDDADHSARARIDHVDPVAVHRVSITSHGRIFDVRRHIVNLDVGRNLRSNTYAEPGRRRHANSLASHPRVDPAVVLWCPLKLDHLRGGRAGAKKNPGGERGAEAGCFFHGVLPDLIVTGRMNVQRAAMFR